MRITGQNKWNMKIIMRKNIIHFTIWLIGLFCYGILYNFEHQREIRSMSILLVGCLLFYSIYYISFFSKAKKVEYSVNASGVLGGRGVGLLINMFVLEYILELYDNLFISHILVIGSIIILFIFRKYVKYFWTENLWNRHLTIVFFAFNILISALISLLGVICEDFVLVEVDSISVKYKVMLIIIYMLVFKITQMPDSVFIKFSSKNADILENSELGRK